MGSEENDYKVADVRRTFNLKFNEATLVGYWRLVHPAKRPCFAEIQIVKRPSPARANQLSQNCPLRNNSLGSLVNVIVTSWQSWLKMKSIKERL